MRRRNSELTWAAATIIVTLLLSAGMPALAEPNPGTPFWTLVLGGEYTYMQPGLSVFAQVFVPREFMLRRGKSYAWEPGTEIPPGSQIRLQIFSMAGQGLQDNGYPKAAMHHVYRSLTPDEPSSKGVDGLYKLGTHRASHFYQTIEVDNSRGGYMMFTHVYADAGDGHLDQVWAEAFWVAEREAILDGGFTYYPPQDAQLGDLRAKLDPNIGKGTVRITAPAGHVIQTVTVYWGNERGHTLHNIVGTTEVSGFPAGNVSVRFPRDSADPAVLGLPEKAPVNQVLLSGGTVHYDFKFLKKGGAAPCGR